ncbi:MAG TPA: Bax inhibitor-1/YccA family protein, partial [Acidimicrobiales bacterium]
MANPALNDKTFAPERLRTFDPRATSDASGTEVWRDRMTLDGVVLRCLTLFPILLATGWFGWQSVERTATGVEMPGWLFPVLIGTLVVAVVTVLRPQSSRYTAPVY